MFSLLLICLSLNALPQWTSVITSASSGLNGAFFVDENTGYIVGGGVLNGVPDTTNAIIMKTTDGGVNWSTIYEQGGESLIHVFVIDGIIYAYGKGPSNQNILVYSDDSGNSWSSDTVSFSTFNMQYSDGIVYVMSGSNDHMQLNKVDHTSLEMLSDSILLFGVNGNELLYVNENMDMLKSDNQGSNWYPLEEHPDGFGTSQLGFSSMKSFGDKIILHYTYPNYTCYSEDNGATWTSTMDDAYTGGPVAIVNDSTMYSVFYNTIAVTFNLISWSTQYQTGQTIRNVYFYNDTMGFVLCNNGRLYRTTNGGIPLGVPETELKKKV